jgi:hypothetical protein
MKVIFKIIGVCVLRSIIEKVVREIQERDAKELEPK